MHPVFPADPAKQNTFLRTVIRSEYQNARNWQLLDEPVSDFRELFLSKQLLFLRLRLSRSAHGPSQAKYIPVRCSTSREPERRSMAAAG